MYYEEDRIPYDEPDQGPDESSKSKESSQDKEKPLSK